MGRPRYDSPQGDVYGGNDYRASRTANGNGHGYGGHRADNGYGQPPTRFPDPPAQPAASDGRGRGTGYERSPGGRPGDPGRRDDYAGGNGGGRRGYGRSAVQEDYAGGNGSGRRPASPRDNAYGRDDHYGNGPVDYGRAGTRRGDRDRGNGYSGGGHGSRSGADGGREGGWPGESARGDEDGGPGQVGRHGSGRRGQGLLAGWAASFRRPSRDEFGDEFGPGGSGRDGGGGRKGGKGGKARRPKRKGDWWRHWTLKKAFAILMAGFGVIIVTVATWVGISYSSTPIPTDVSLTALQQASTVYFSDGKTAVGTFGTVNRQVLTYNQIPAQLRNAVLAAEDRNFYNEGGISPTGILRAAYDDLTGSGSSLQGGSTITEQFVKNYYANVSSAQTISNKIKEIFIAVKLARSKSKAWILTQYLNTIYFGDGAYGVEAAAKTYFGKSVGQLNVSQDAMIAALLNAPGQFDPTPGSAGYQPLVARWQYVLQGMVTMHNLSPADESAAKFPKVTSTQAQASGWTGYDGYIMQAVENELENVYHYTPSEIDNDGLHIVTTFSKPMMDALYATVNEEKRKMSQAGPGDGLPSYAHVGAVLEQPSTGAILAMYSGPSYSEPAAQCKKNDCTWDMALENREQVGSSFKPYVLSAARAQGMSVKTSTLDGTSPLCVPGDQFPTQYSVPATAPPPGGCPTSPDGWHQFTNDEGDGASGPQSVVTATAQSLNTAYTDLTHRVGTQNVINMAKNYGVDTTPYLKGGSGLQDMVGQVGLALGTAALTVEEQANMFATLANGGEYNTPHVIEQITKSNALVSSKVEHHEVLTPTENSDVDYALSQTTISGTGTNAEMSDGRPMIGKTGTTSTAQSAFFLGAIPQYALAVGIFTNDQNASTAAGAQTLNHLGGLGGYGGDWPALIWHAYAQKEFLSLPIEQFPAPDFGGTAWNLMGAGQVRSNSNPHPGNTPGPPKRHHHTCIPSPLNNDCQGNGGSPPPSTSPPPSSSPPPTCNPANPHCQTPPPLSPQQSASQTAGAGTTNAADRARRLPLSRGG